MQTPVQIVSRHLTLSPLWRARLTEKAAKLEEFEPRVTACRIVVETRPRHPHKGGRYKVRIDVAVPGAFIIVDREPSPSLDEAIELAFDAVGRRLQDRARRRQRQIKTHVAPPRDASASCSRNPATASWRRRTDARSTSTATASSTGRSAG